MSRKNELPVVKLRQDKIVQVLVDGQTVPVTILAGTEGIVINKPTRNTRQVVLPYGRHCTCEIELPSSMLARVAV